MERISKNYGTKKTKNERLKIDNRDNRVHDMD